VLILRKGDNFWSWQSSLIVESKWIAISTNTTAVGIELACEDTERFILDITCRQGNIQGGYALVPKNVVAGSKTQRRRRLNNTVPYRKLH
jgi:hypothetical protein